MTTSATIGLKDSFGVERCSLEIDCLERDSSWRELDAIKILDATEVEASLPEVQLLEEVEYHYNFQMVGDTEIQKLEPSELFNRNRGGLASGRLKTGRRTGTVRVVVVLSNGDRCTGDFEVRSRKLDYETEYQRMMLRLAEEGAELVQSAFSASSFGGFDPDQVNDSRTLYQRFAFVQSLLDSEPFAEAMEILRYRPHSVHSGEQEIVDPTRYLKPDRALARQLTGPAERQSVVRPVGGMSSIPRTVTREVQTESLDTIPNRFVRFALEHWKVLAARVAEQLPKSGVQSERGRSEAQRIEARLEQLLTIPAVAEAGRLNQFPSASTVLHSRAGYREIFRAFLLSDAAASLSWDGGEEVFSAGNRDVATLYEYWVFLELARILERIPGFSFDRSELVKESSDGLGLELRKGSEVVVTGNGVRRGRPVRLELWFNRTFRQSSGRDASWTVQMRPDCSLKISPAGSAWDQDVWVHFDAKYRLDHKSFFNAEVESKSDEPATGDISTAKKDDLRKMHAYRDAIRRTAGAYVLYPGMDDDEPQESRQYHEVLPGLGAFALRPSDDGEASVATTRSLQQFLVDVIDHSASQGTGRERARYWENVSYSNSDGSQQRFDYEPTIDKPPADSSVLLGFVRSLAHREWIDEKRLYNLRADPDRNGSVSLGSPEVRADFVALYDAQSEDVSVYRTTGALFVRTDSELGADAYPGHRGPGAPTLYLCLELGEQVDIVLSGTLARALAPSDGSPAVLSFEEMRWEQAGSVVTSDSRSPWEV